jgi:hypothetical protein
VATDYTDLVLDLLAAFGADSFHYSASDYDAERGRGRFWRTLTHDVGSTSWPWEFRHTWSVPAAVATRDALVRRGWIEPLPRGALVLGDQHRVTSKALALLANEETPSWKTSRAPWQAYAAARAAAEADRKAHPGVRQRL